MSHISDYRIAILMGIMTGILLMPALSVSGVPVAQSSVASLILPLLFVLGIWVGRVMESALGFGGRFSKYAVTGFLSFSIDFAILNIVSALTGITEGATIGWVNVPGFCVAITNAYIWNRLWVFPRAEGERIFARFSHFLFVGGIGVVLNSTFIVLLTTYVAHPMTLTDYQWLNIAKIGASAVAILWNFFGYKTIAFQRLTT